LVAVGIIIMATVTGTGAGEQLWGVAGQNTKIEGKAGDDNLIGSTGNDTLLGGHGSDVMFGGAGKDTFVFDKFAAEGDVDYVTDFQLGTDMLQFGPGVTITKLEIADAGQSFNGISLHNSAKDLDVKLTLQIVDGTKTITQEVYLVDALKNSGWHLAQFEEYLASIGQDVSVS
jgi:Ca2+-binding RTX toxin-like protein